ncbi:MAG: ATP-dependent Clp protease proteolytic subunit [Cyanobacteriota bacterium]|nr:ATP-dependent Clp protease proteolytic subunit [Cyanobacteriota bacterium]
MDLQAVQSNYYSGGVPFRTPPPDLPSLLLQERIIYLGLPLAEEPEANVTKLIIAQLLYLQYEDREKPIRMYINSTGTYSYDTAAFAIMDTMNYIKPPVHTICIGNAMGMAAMLLSAGAKGFRASLPNATILLHQPYGGTRGQASDIQIRTKEVLTVRQMMLEQLAKNTGQSIDRIKQDTERFLFMTPEEAKEYGLIDQVLTQNKSLPPALAATAG